MKNLLAEDRGDSALAGMLQLAPMKSFLPIYSLADRTHDPAVVEIRRTDADRMTTARFREMLARAMTRSEE